jgi:hypothetical protein
LANGGSGYFPKRIVLPHLKTKRLNLIGDAPEFSMPGYVVYPLECDRDLFGSALEIMHRTANEKRRQPLARKRRSEPREKIARSAARATLTNAGHCRVDPNSDAKQHRNVFDLSDVSIFSHLTANIPRL